MVLEKIPTFSEVQTWAQNQGWITADEAPVQSVNGSQGNVTIDADIPTSTQNTDISGGWMSYGNLSEGLLIDGIRVSYGSGNSCSSSNHNIGLNVTLTDGRSYSVYAALDESGSSDQENFKVGMLDSFSRNTAHSCLSNQTFEAHVSALPDHKHDI